MEDDKEWRSVRQRVADAASQIAGNYCRAKPVGRQHKDVEEIPSSFINVLEKEPPTVVPKPDDS